MAITNDQQWERFKAAYFDFRPLGLAIDLSKLDLKAEDFKKVKPKMARAFSAMKELEQGAIANPDEKRMVGHYWLRDSSLAPSSEIRNQIDETIRRIKEFAASVHSNKLKAEKGPFKRLLLIGIGGSALGPQFVSHALSMPGKDKLRISFFDNTDPDGMDQVLAEIEGELAQTLCVVISKSGGTKETRNGMLEAKAAFERAGLNFSNQAVAITGEGSELDRFASDQGWLARFPMWDWVGGRTSETSAVGLLPAALQGFDIDSMLRGAAACDRATRVNQLERNPAAILAATWNHCINDRGKENLVILPYKDRLELLSKYLQQLIMESLGKELDLHGKVVNQGITVFGNKGSTDQHAYVQQLRDGRSSFSALFVEVLKDKSAGGALDVEPSVTSGDYLHGFLLGTREALFEKGRESVTLTLDEVSAFSIGMLIALFERAVGLYAQLIEINAYHQPGVEAGKKAASAVIALQRQILEILREEPQGLTVDQIADHLGLDRRETIFKICEHLSANPDRRLKRTMGEDLFSSRYQLI